MPVPLISHVLPRVDVPVSEGGHARAVPGAGHPRPRVREGPGAGESAVAVGHAVGVDVARVEAVGAVAVGERELLELYSCDYCIRGVANVESG